MIAIFYQIKVEVISFCRPTKHQIQLLSFRQDILEPHATSQLPWTAWSKAAARSTWTGRPPRRSRTFPSDEVSGRADHVEHI